MSIEQSIVNDVVDVKKAISDNWEHILATADSIEKLITDGLEWVLAKDAKGNYIHLDQIKKSFEDVANTIENDLDLSTIEQDFDKAIGSVEGELNQYLKPMLSQIKNIKAEMTTEELFKLIENSMPNIPGLSEVTEGLEDVLSPTKRIVQEVLKEGFSIKLKDLPLPAGASSTGSDNADSSLFDVLTSGLDTHLDSVFNKHGDTIESLLTNFFGLIDKDVISSLETNTKDLVTQFESGEINTKKLMSSLKTLTINEGENAKDIGSKFIHNIMNDIDNLGQIMEELLLGEIKEDVLLNIYNDLTVNTDAYKKLSGNFKNQNQIKECTVIGLLSLMISIPITIIEKSAFVTVNGIDKSIFQSVDGKLVTYGLMQLADGILMFIDDSSNFIPCVDDYFGNHKNKTSYLRWSFWTSLQSTIVNITAQCVSFPTTTVGWQWGVWSYQFVFVLFGTYETYVYHQNQKIIEDPYNFSNEKKSKFLDSIDSILFENNKSNSSTNGNTNKSLEEELQENFDKFQSRVDLEEIFLSSLESLTELLHLIFFIILWTVEDGDDSVNTPNWQQSCYILDPIPSLIGSIFNRAANCHDIKYIESKNTDTHSLSQKRRLGLLGMLFDLIPQLVYGILYLDNSDTDNSDTDNSDTDNSDTDITIQSLNWDTVNRIDIIFSVNVYADTLNNISFDKTLLSVTPTNPIGPNREITSIAGGGTTTLKIYLSSITPPNKNQVFQLNYNSLSTKRIYDKKGKIINVFPRKISYTH